MNDEKEKYSDGTSLDASKMSRQEKLKAIDYWCEGNQQLKKLLLYFNEENIETIGCCSGHEEVLGYAYIGIKLGNPQDSKVIELLTKLEMENLDIKIGFIRGVIDRSFCVLTADNIREQ